MTKKIVVLDGYALNPGDLTWEALACQGDLTVYDRTPPELVKERILEAEIVFTNKTLLSNELLKSCPKLEYIGILATGMNVLNVDYAKSLGIVVRNVPDYSTDAVAQLTMALLLEICHHVGDHSQSVKNGDWSRSKDFCYWQHPLFELSGKTMGLVGSGKIGQRTEALAKAFGMKVLKTSKSMKEGSVDLETLFRESDVISLHCPLTPETQNLINATSIERMKDGVIILNTARGPLIDEEALADALKRGKVFAAAVDVVSKEPIDEANPLLKAPNCLITPHIAWAPKEARERLMDITAKRLSHYLNQTEDLF